MAFSAEGLVGIRMSDVFGVLGFFLGARAKLHPSYCWYSGVCGCPAGLAPRFDLLAEPAETQTSRPF